VNFFTKSSNCWGDGNARRDANASVPPSEVFFGDAFLRPPPAIIAAHVTVHDGCAAMLAAGFVIWFTLLTFYIISIYILFAVEK